MVHTFGCSFTYGSGIRPEPLPGGLEGEAFLGSPVYKDLIWPIELGRLLDQQVTNQGLGGTSNSWILQRVMESMQDFEKGDIVILGQTDTPRFNFPVGDGDIKSSGFLHIIPDAANWLWTEKAVELGYLDYAGVRIEKEEAALLLSYYLYMFPKFLEFYDNLYNRQFESICAFLNNMGVRCIYWRTGVWSCFERLDTWSFKYCKDGHWSPNGHLEFAAVLKYVITTNIHTLDMENINSLLREVELPDKYIRFSKDDL